MFRKTLTIKTTSLAAAIFLSVPLITIALWLFASYITRVDDAASFNTSLEIFFSLLFTVSALLAVCALVLSVISALKKGPRIDAWDRKEDILLCVLSLIITVLYAPMFLQFPF